MLSSGGPTNESPSPLRLVSPPLDVFCALTSEQERGFVRSAGPFATFSRKRKKGMRRYHHRRERLNSSAREMSWEEQRFRNQNGARRRAQGMVRCPLHPREAPQRQHPEKILCRRQEKVQTLMLLQRLNHHQLQLPLLLSLSK